MIPLKKNLINIPESDECYTPAGVIQYILDLIPSNVRCVWCPFDTAESNIVKELQEKYDVIYTHKDEGCNFFTYEPIPCMYDCIVSNPPFTCYSDDTEVFTKRGWKKFLELNANDNVLSVKNDREISWDNISFIIKKEVNEKICHFKTKNMDLLVTKDHRMFAFSKHTNQLCIDKKDGDLIKASDISDKHYFPKNGYKWKGKIKDLYLTLPETFNPPKSRVKYYPELKIPLKDWLPFFGFWLADGWTSSYRGRARGYTVGLKQAEPRWKEVEVLLSNLPFKYTKYVNKRYDDTLLKANYEIYNKQLWDYLVKFGKSQTKFVPKWIKELPPEYLEMFMYGYTLGDSFKSKGKNSITTAIHYGSVSKQLLEDIQEILLKLGNITNITSEILKKGNVYYKLILNKESCSNRAMYYGRCKQEDVFYKGFVWCLTLRKNSVFLVRRNNRIMFCGNCKTAVLKRLYELKKPFFMLLPLTALEGKKRGKLFEKHGINIRVLENRLNFTGGKGTWFNTSWFYGNMDYKNTIDFVNNKEINKKQLDLF